MLESGAYGARGPWEPVSCLVSSTCCRLQTAGSVQSWGADGRGGEGRSDGGGQREKKEREGERERESRIE